MDNNVYKEIYHILKSTCDKWRVDSKIVNHHNEFLLIQNRVFVLLVFIVRRRILSLILKKLKKICRTKGYKQNPNTKIQAKPNNSSHLSLYIKIRIMIFRRPYN